MLADYFYSTSDDGRWAKRLLGDWSGWEHIQAARAAGRGIILVTGHLGHWELGGLLLAQRGVPLTIVTLEEPSTGLTRWRDEVRRRAGIKTIAVGPGREFAFVEMIKVLERGECVAMLVDRPYLGSGSPVTFFGQPRPVFQRPRTAAAAHRRGGRAGLRRAPPLRAVSLLRRAADRDDRRARQARRPPGEHAKDCLCL